MLHFVVRGKSVFCDSRAALERIADEYFPSIPVSEFKLVCDKGHVACWLRGCKSCHEVLRSVS